MLFTLEAARALFYRAISEAQVDAPVGCGAARPGGPRHRPAHGASRLTQEAIRVCGGRALLKRYPLERYARDARAGA